MKTNEEIRDELKEITGSDVNWDIERFIFKLLSQQKTEIISGKFFNEITINEKVKIPKELLGYIEKEVRQKMINIIPGEIMDEDSDYYTGWNACIRTIREHLT